MKYVYISIFSKGSGKMKKILVADNVEMNKSILRELFGSQYDMIETDSSEIAFRLLIQYKHDISIILINETIAQNFTQSMIKTLKDLNIFENIPLIIILNKDYLKTKGLNINFPCSDVISSPVNPYIIKKRVANLIDLYSHKNDLEKRVQEQTAKIIAQNDMLKIQQKKINTINNDMLDTLSTVIEYRDVESGRHIHRIKEFTRVLLRVLAKNYPKYNLIEEKINLIASASSIHDIGKIAIPDAILLSPRRLTYDEFKIMKFHTIKGCEILNQLDSVERNEYFKYCYEICRYHHEKWDGLGYPDGLVGDEIPISAQVVSVADCYDALTSERPYKAAFTHEQAVEMIRTGACGAFSEEMMDCFSRVLPQFKKLAQEYKDCAHTDKDISFDERKKYIKNNNEDHSKDIYLKMDRDDLISTIEHQKNIMNETHKRDSEILYRISDFVFECDLKHDTFHDCKDIISKLYGYTPKNYGEAVMMFAENCAEDEKSKFIRTFRIENIRKEALNGKKRVALECYIKVSKKGYSLVKCVVIPFLEDGILRKIFCSAVIVHNKTMYSNMSSITKRLDPVTGLLNFESMKNEVDDYISHSGKNGYHILVNIDIDDFKNINRQTSYRFGNDILCDIANELKDCSSQNSIIGRAEDDNFLVFIKDCPNSSESLNIVERIFRCLHKTYTFDDKTSRNVSVSMGISSYPQDGDNFEALFSNVLKAADIAKLNGKDMYLFYNNNMKENWEIKQYSQMVAENEKVNLIDFNKRLIPVEDISTGRIISYDFVEFSEEFGTNFSFDDIYESFYYNNNITALSLNNMRRIISCIYRFEQENLIMPEISIITMFSGDDIETVIKAIGEILEEYPVDCRKICIDMTQDMLKKLNMKGLVRFIEALREHGFKTGVYNVGMNSINVKCFTEKLFDRVTFADSFLNDIADGIYPVELITYLIEYFSKLGTEVYMPININREFINSIKQTTKLPFGVHKNEILTIEEFKEHMRLISIIPKYPILSHESTSLVITEKMYDEILIQTKSFIFEWIPRIDTLKVSSSFERMYGYTPKQNDFINDIKKYNIFHPDDIKKFIEKINSARSGNSDTECLIRVYNTFEDKYIWNKMKFIPIRSATGVPVKILGICIDVSEEKENYSDETRRNRTDYITNLYNKSATENKIRSYLYDEGVSGNHAMIVAEICNFEELEKNLGTVFANAVLKEIATKIKDVFRDSDIIGRNRGNQFTVFVKNMSNLDKLMEKAEQVSSIISNKYQSDSDDIIIVGKSGISMFPQNGLSYDELYSAAIKALYFAKHNINKNAAFLTETDERNLLT